MAIKTNITLYTEGTPNGLKTTIAMAELNLEYKVRGKHANYEATSPRTSPFPVL
jgi:hypothetical protein